MPRVKSVGENVGDLVEGFKRFRTGTLFQIGGVIIGMMSFLAVGLSLISFIIRLVGFLPLFVSTGFFKRYDPQQLGIGRTGMISMIIGFLCAMGAVIVGALWYATGTGTGTEEAYLTLFLGLIIGGLVSSVAGAVLVLIFLFRLATVPKVNRDIKSGAIMLVIGAVVPLLAIFGGEFFSFMGLVVLLLGWFLLYSGSEATLKSLVARRG